MWFNLGDKQHGAEAWRQVDLNSQQAPLPMSCVTSGKSLSYSESVQLLKRYNMTSCRHFAKIKVLGT